MDKSVVSTAVRAKYAPPFLGTLMRFEINHLTRSIHAIADAKLNPATTALRD